MSLRTEKNSLKNLKSALLTTATPYPFLVNFCISVCQNVFSNATHKFCYENSILVVWRAESNKCPEISEEKSSSKLISHRIATKISTQNSTKTNLKLPFSDLNVNFSPSSVCPCMYNK